MSATSPRRVAASVLGAPFAPLTTGFSLALGLLAAPLAYGEFLVVDYRFGR